MKDILYLFFPPRCAACGRELPEGEVFLCPKCRWEAPLTEYWTKTDNPLAERLRNHVPIEKAAALLFFSHNGVMRDLIHSFKYHSAWRAAERAGEWMGREMGKHFNDVDVLISVPLHQKKHLKRGYNQAEHLARGMARVMGTQVETDAVSRQVSTQSQARKQGAERWDNVWQAFAVRRPEALRGRHVLLVDDVLTTGATMLSLAEAILRAAPDCRLSIATFATTREREKKKIRSEELGVRSYREKFLTPHS